MANCSRLLTFSRSWYHCRQIFRSASKNVSFRSLAIIAIQSRETGSANRRASTARCSTSEANSIRVLALSWFGSSAALSMTTWISGGNTPISLASSPSANPIPAPPLENASAELRDLERCRAFWTVPFDWSILIAVCWPWPVVGVSNANLTRGPAAACKMQKRIFAFKLQLMCVAT